MNKWLCVVLLTFTTLLLHANTPPPASQVFQVDATLLDANNFMVHWNIKPGYFLYSDRIKINSQGDKGIQLGALRLPAPQTRTDKQKHTYNIYRNQLAIPVSILGIQPGETLLKLNYQGCSDDGFCYPPESKEIKVQIAPNLALASVNLEVPPPPPEISLNKAPGISQIFTQHHWLITLAIFFGLGLLLSFTPCILPMIPVLSGIIIGHGKSVTTRKAFFLSLSYVLSMSLTYACFGALIALLGTNLQISMQSPWAISFISIIFVFLALSMFGFYEFKLPDSWQSKIAGSSRNQRAGHYLGAAIMGCLSTLILSPCVTAPLIGVLTFIAQTHNIWLGSVTLFVLSLGMGTPLLLIGTSAGKWLPQTGSWMNTVKAFFGVLLLAIALYLIARILPATLVMALWACLLIFTGIYSGALLPAHDNQSRFFQGLGILLLSYGLLILIGTSMGSTNPLQPLASIKVAPFQDTSKILPRDLNSILVDIHKAAGQPVILDFYADWCASCKIMEKTVFQDPTVFQALKSFKLIKIDITANTPQNQEIIHYFNVIAPPVFIFFNRQGEELNALRLVGEASVEEFLQTLGQVDSDQTSSST